MIQSKLRDFVRKSEPSLRYYLRFTYIFSTEQTVFQYTKSNTVNASIQKVLCIHTHDKLYVVPWPVVTYFMFVENVLYTRLTVVLCHVLHTYGIVLCAFITKQTMVMFTYK